MDQPDKTIPSPVNHLHNYGRVYKGAWKLVDMFRKSRGQDLPDWPNWCFLPLSASYSIISHFLGVERLKPEHSIEVGRFGALAIWRYSQGIYRFHPEILDALWNTKLTDNLPCDVLMRLPQWCCYIETPGRSFFDAPLRGFFAHLEWDAATNGRKELRLLLDIEDGAEGFLLPVPLHIDSGSLVEAINGALIESHVQATLAGLSTKILSKDYSKEQVEQLKPLVSLLLYLCADEPEIDSLRCPGETPTNPRPKKIKGGWKLFPAQNPYIWDVGLETGKKLEQVDLQSSRRSDTDEDRASPTPHLRVAHWHGYWTGSRKNGEQRFQYRWLSPIFVNADLIQTDSDDED